MAFEDSCETAWPEVFTRSAASDAAIHMANVATPASKATRDRSQRRLPVRVLTRVSARPARALPRPQIRWTVGEDSLPASSVRWVRPVTADARCQLDQDRLLEVCLLPCRAASASAV